MRDKKTRYFFGRQQGKFIAGFIDNRSVLPGVEALAANAVQIVQDTIDISPETSVIEMLQDLPVYSVHGYEGRENLSGSGLGTVLQGKHAAAVIIFLLSPNWYDSFYMININAILVKTC